MVFLEKKKRPILDCRSCHCHNIVQSDVWTQPAIPMTAPKQTSPALHSRSAILVVICRHPVVCACLPDTEVLDKQHPYGSLQRKVKYLTLWTGTSSLHKMPRSHIKCFESPEYACSLYVTVMVWLLHPAVYFNCKDQGDMCSWIVQFLLKNSTSG